jgi:hypothetical protein
MRLLLTILFFFILGSVSSQILMLNKYVRRNGASLEIDSLGTWKTLATQGYVQGNMVAGGTTLHGSLTELPVDSSGHTGSPFGLWGFDENGESQSLLFDVNVQRWDQGLDNFRGLTGTGLLRQTSLSTYALGGEIVTAEIGNNQITNAKLSESLGLSVLGRSAASAGTVEYITATAANQVFRVSTDGLSVGPGAINLESDDAVSGVLDYNHLPGGGALIGNWDFPNSEADSLLGTDGVNLWIRGVRVISTDASVTITFDSTERRVIYDLSVVAGGAGTVETGVINTLAYYAANGTTVSDLAAITASRAVVSDANGLPVAATTTTTQINYISSATGTTGTTSTNIVFSTSPTITTPTLTTPVINMGSDANGDIYTRIGGVFSRLAAGLEGEVLTITSGLPSWETASSGSGDVVGPASATDDALAVFDGTTGKLLQNSVYIATSTLLAIPDGAGLTIGGATKMTVGSARELQMAGTAAADGSMLLAMFSTTNATGPDYAGYKSGDGTIYTATSVSSGDYLVSLSGYGAQQTGTIGTVTLGGQLSFRVNGTVTSGAGADMPTSMFISLAADGAAAVDRLEITSAAMLPVNAGYNLGSTTAPLGNVYVGSGGSVDFNASDSRIVDGADILSFINAGSYRVDDDLSPTANDGAPLGTTALGWSDQFFASGAVINFNNGNMTITHAAGLLTVAGGTFVVAGFSAGIASTSIDITLSTQHTVLVDASGATRTITLPAAASNSGRIFIIKKTDNSVNTVVVDGNASETIDGATTQTLANEWDAIQIQSNGTNWFILATM